jgi:hypothetical protein
LLSKAGVDVRIESEQIEQVIKNEVIKREVVEGEKADEATRKVAKASGKLLRKASTKGDESTKPDIKSPDVKPAPDDPAPSS